MNKAPAYQWYPEKAAIDTRRLKWESKGVYRELLDVIWIQFQDTCSIPNNDDFIASELGCDIELWKRAKADIMNPIRPLFSITETNSLFNKGLYKERVKQVERREQLKKNGSKGGRPKKPKEKLNESLLSPSLFLSSFQSSVLDNKEFLHWWKEWLLYRFEHKKWPAVTEQGAKIQLSKFMKWGCTVAIESIQTAIELGWRGTFEPGKNRNESSSPASATSTNTDALMKAIDEGKI